MKYITSIRMPSEKDNDFEFGAIWAYKPKNCLLPSALYYYCGSRWMEYKIDYQEELARILLFEGIVKK